ncbi:MAG TPA: amidohydrolase [Candidatus Agrococcus pullicola]|uniref:Amidohydrolase n=1 Tax=Candidatus Agrococcus pullicola TaxID=2838429 RepID=A0A9D1YT96_9MICO|nr:amidohydrolase [Candidatus Agrococcus pullicola]
MDVDLILRGGRILTMGSAGVTDSIAVHQGRILALGRDAESLTARVERNLEGRTVTPGFIDAHAHSVWFGLTLVELDVAPARSIDELYDLVAERAAETAQSEWVVGAGFNQMYTQNEYPDPVRLNEAAGGRPVWIKHTSGHACVIDRRAIEITRVHDYLERGIDGGRIVVDEHGEPTGLLEEQAMRLVQDIMLPYPLGRIEQALEAATRHYLTEGLTSVTDAGIAGGWIAHSPQEFAAYQNALRNGRLHTRQQVMPESSTITEFGEPGAEGHYSGFSAGIRSGLGNDRLQLGPAKFFLDGSILGATARMSEEYHHCPGSHGYYQGDRGDIRDRALAAGRAGWTLAMHAVGDEAVDLAIEIAGTLRAEGIEPPIPHRIEHGGVVRPEQIARLAEVDLTIVGQPYFVSVYGDGMRRFIGDERADGSFPAKSLLDAGLNLAISSDRPVAQGAPLRVMQSAVERLTASGHVYGGHERLTPQEALAAYTTGPARLTGWEGVKGVLQPGALADLTILGADPTKVPAAEISSVPVEATVVGGEAKHDPNGIVSA